MRAPASRSAPPVIREDVVSRLHDRVARESTLGVVPLWWRVGRGSGREPPGRLILEHGPPPPAAVREPLAVLHQEVDVMQRARHRRCGECLQLFRVPMDLGHSGAVGERLAVARNAGPVGGDHHGIGEDRSQQASVLTDGDNLPVLVSPELGEREPTRHLHGVLVLGGQGAAAQRTDDGRHDSNRPQAFALHNTFLLCEGRAPQLTAFFTSAPILASAAAVSSFSAKATGHTVPSSRFALSLKPNVAYLALNLCALWKKQTTLPSLAYAGIPYQVLGERAGALALMMAWSRSAMARSGFGISGIFASTSLSRSSFLARGPRCGSASSSRARSFIATRSSSVNPLTALPVTIELLADFRVSVFGLREPPHTDFGWTPRRSANADPRYSNMRRLTDRALSCGRLARRRNCC